MNDQPTHSSRIVAGELVPGTWCVVVTDYHDAEKFPGLGSSVATGIFVRTSSNPDRSGLDDYHYFTGPSVMVSRLYHNVTIYPDVEVIDDNAVVREWGIPASQFVH